MIALVLPLMLSMQLNFTRVKFWLEVRLAGNSGGMFPHQQRHREGHHRRRVIDDRTPFLNVSASNRNALFGC